MHAVWSYFSKILIFILLLLKVSFGADAPVSVPENKDLPLWEYGLGIGLARYWHYPASDQTKDIYLPFPTFIYRGEILRADDREGAKAYLIRDPSWSLELGGGVLPAVRTEDNFAREGMDPLPWGIQLGPQLIYKKISLLDFRFGVYQSIVTDFSYTRSNGQLYTFKTVFKLSDYWQAPLNGAFFRASLSLTLKAASEEFMKTYYSVEPKFSKADRPEYNAKGGFLSYDLGYFQSLIYRKHSIYFGLSHAKYDLSENKKSPLHKADSNLSLFFGITYTLGESEKRAIPEDRAEGLIEKVEHKFHREKIHKDAPRAE